MIKSAIFVDFDNIFISLQEQSPELASYFATRPSEWLKQLEFDQENPFRRFLVRRCYLNPKSFGNYRPNFIAAAFDVIDCPSVTQQGKTAADMYMAIDIIDKLSHATRFDNFLLMSADADFTPVLKKLREYDRTTTVILAGPSSTAYKAAADSSLQFSDLLSTPSIQDSVTTIEEPDFISPDHTIEPPPVRSRKLTATTKSEVLYFLKEELSKSTAPISTAKALNLLKDKFGNSATEWFGHNKAALFFNEINIASAGIQFSSAPPGSLLLPEKHTLPHSGAPTWLSSPEFSERIKLVAKKVCALTETPCISPDAFKACFSFIAEKTNQSPVPHQVELAKNLRDFAQSKNIPISRTDANGIIFMINRNGAYLGAPCPATDIINSYAKGIIHQCGHSQWELSQDEKSELHSWLSGDGFIQEAQLTNL
jgi:uncharacterized LabA/DUF88 family protein